MEVVAHFDCSAADAPPGMRLFEMAACVIDNPPSYAMLLDVVGQERLREISIVEMPILGERHDLWAHLVEDLPRQCRQSAAGAGGHIGLLHDLPRGFLLRCPRFPRHSRTAIADH